MLVLYSFRVKKGAKEKDSPTLCCNDMAKLHELFPDNLVWGEHFDNAINIRYVDRAQAEALYRAMTEYYAENEVSHEIYRANSAWESIPASSDLQGVFDDLIGFFEAEFGFSSPEEIRETILVKQRERQTRSEQHAASLDAALEAFGEFPLLRPPTDETIRGKLSAKLLEYKGRLTKTRDHPELAFMLSSSFRDSTYKILLIEALLAEDATEISLLSLAKEQKEKRKDYFCPEDFFNACCVISAYLGTPITEGELIPAA